MDLDLNASAEPASGVLRPDSHDVTPDLAALKRALGRGRKHAPETLLGLAEAALAEAGALVQPAAVWAEVAAEGLAGELLPGVPAEELAGVSSLIGVVCTIGEALEAQAQRRFAAGEYAHSYLLDVAGGLAVAALAQHVERLLRAGRSAARWAPGDGADERALGAQRMLFALLPTDEIGVRLSEDGMMAPAKSLSFVLLVGSRPEGLQCLGRCSQCVWNGACGRQRGGRSRAGDRA